MNKSLTLPMEWTGSILDCWPPSPATSSKKSFSMASGDVWSTFLRLGVLLPWLLLRAGLGLRYKPIFSMKAASEAKASAAVGNPKEKSPGKSSSVVVVWLEWWWKWLLASISLEHCCSCTPSCCRGVLQINSKVDFPIYASSSRLDWLCLQWSLELC